MTFLHLRNDEVEVRFAVLDRVRVETGMEVRAGQALAVSGVDACTWRPSLYLGLVAP